MFASKNHDVQNCVSVGSGDPLNRTNGATFYERPDYLSDLLSWQVCSIQPFGTLTIALVALAATETLIPLAVASKPLAFDLAIMAGRWACLSAKQARECSLKVGMSDSLRVLIWPRSQLALRAGLSLSP
jgi:hypothetical protein